MHSIAIVEMAAHAARYHLVMDFLRLRKRIFMDKMDWPLYSHENFEFEQYDSLSAVYIIAYARDEVLGGARLIRTDNRVGSGKVKYSYMIRDAHAGLLPGMPSDICFDEPPIERNTWELTRLATVNRQNVAADILNSANDYLADQSAKRCFFLGPPAFLRMAKSLNYAPVRMGPIVRNDDGAFLAFSCPVINGRQGAASHSEMTA